MKPVLVRVLLWASLLLPLLAGGFLLGARIADDQGRVDRLEREAGRLRARAGVLTRQRDVLRRDRDQLEARLAASRPQALCPQAFVGTGALLERFEIDYRCGWHVVRDARPQLARAERPGTVVELTLFSRVPIDLIDGGGPAADIEVADWFDDPAAEGDKLPPLDSWLAGERRSFTGQPEDRPIESGAGLTIHRFSGTADLEGAAVQLTVMLWEYEDATGARHVVRAVAVDPSEQVRVALERLARSFRVLQP